MPSYNCFVSASEVCDCLACSSVTSISGPAKPISQHIGLFTRPLQSGKVSRPKPLQATHARYRERDEVGVGITVLDNWQIVVVHVDANTRSRQKPEERELEKKRAELASLEAILAERELDLATLQAELHSFQARYLNIVGTRFAQLDEIEAQIAEAQARLSPNDQEAQRRAERSRAQAQESAQSAGDSQELTQAIKFRPSASLKKLYREVAKAIHPDLTTDEEERARRHQMMAIANRAYEAGDEETLRAILLEWESSPELVKGEGAGAELIRVIRKIAQVEGRLRAIEAEIETIKRSDLYQLWAKAEGLEESGRDLLAELAAQVDNQIAEARKRLEALFQWHYLQRRPLQ
jgi:hypothetical protein